MTNRVNYRRYYLNRRAKQLSEIELKAKDRLILVSYTIDPTGVLENKYISELMKRYGYSLQIEIDK